MLLRFTLNLKVQMELFDTAVDNNDYEAERRIHKTIEDLRDQFHVDFKNEYGFSFSDFEETLNLSYDYSC